MAKTFTELKKQKNENELNEFCRKVVKEYATSDIFKNEKYFCEKYGLTKSCFYKIKQYVMDNNLVSKEIIIKMTNKAITNQQRHNAYAGGSSINRYDAWRQQNNKK